MSSAEITISPLRKAQVRLYKLKAEINLTQEQYDALNDLLKEVGEEIKAYRAALRAVRYAVRDFGE